MPWGRGKWLPDKPNPARVYDALLGGKNNFPVDRAVATELRRAKPDLAANVAANRQFLGRVVQYLATEAGISQYLDIGAGIPAQDNTHEVAQHYDPSARVVYVDNDTVALTYARAMLASTPGGAVTCVQADLRDPGGILADARPHLDWAKPVAVMLLGILYLIPDHDDPHQIVTRLMAATAPGSYLAISHPASDIHADQAARGARLYARRTGIPQTNRSREQVTRFFDGLHLAEPGVVQLSQWRPGTGTNQAQVVSSWGAVARKP